jgi:hypothetical protein
VTESSIPEPPRPRVVTTPRSLRRLRVSAHATRWVLYALAAAGIAATVRFTIAPPRVAPPRMPSPPRVDLGAQGFATLFARRYLTWDASRPEAYARALAPFLGEEIDSTAGLRLPASGAQSVQWAEVVQARPIGPVERVYTVAAQTDAAGLVYLAVDVTRDGSGALRLAAYPAIVAAPASRPATSLGRAGAVDVADPSLQRVVERTLRNYLAGSSSNLAADLTTDARVMSPAAPLALQSVTQQRWRPDHTGVIATVVAADQRGASYTLSYELDVVAVGGRWEVAAIQTDPTN